MGPEQVMTGVLAAGRLAAAVLQGDLALWTVIAASGIAALLWAFREHRRVCPLPHHPRRRPGRLPRGPSTRPQNSCDMDISPLVGLDERAADRAKDLAG